MPVVRILLWHGYLMTGSGSNIYTANISRSWRAAGHDVLVMCQERDIAVFPFVDAHGDFGPGHERFDVRETGVAPDQGRCTVVRPAIGPVLPVYVFDEYAGFTAKTFLDLSDEELDNYVETNTEALVAAIESFSPDAIVTGHEVMGPYIAKLACERTGTRFVAKLHGSALEYAVKKQDRYRRYAEEGLSAADIVVGGSEYMVAAAGAVIPGWVHKARVINPGCDVALFKPAPDRRTDDPVAGFVGKLLVSKGVHHFLAALGLTRAPGLRAVIVGFGGYAIALQALADALAAGDRDEVLRIAGDALPGVREFAGSPEADESYFARIREVTVEFTGRLEHGPLAEVLPTWDVLTVPSVLPEAFGLVAVEAAACGVLPVVPNHSGIGEVGARLEADLDLPNALVYDAGDPIRGLGACVDALCRKPLAERLELGRAAAATTRARWSWDRVAADLVRVAIGR
jgi:glycosyltransferase involved in cell wall biosynthesis